MNGAPADMSPNTISRHSSRPSHWIGCRTVLKPPHRSKLRWIKIPEMQSRESNRFNALAVPDDLRTPWDWIDLVIFALLALGGTFLISVVLMFVFSALGISPAQLRTSPRRKVILPS